MTTTTTSSSAGTSSGGFSKRPAYAAAGVAFAFAAVSLFWSLGGTVGLSTLGRVGRLALAHDPTIVRLNWLAAVLKALGGLLALALIQRWGQRLPRRMLLTASWGGAGLLAIYGGLQLTVLSLVQLGVTHPAGPVDWNSIHWRLGLWDMWFLVWGLCLGAAARQYTRQPQLLRFVDEPVDDGPATHATRSPTEPKMGSPR